MRRDLLSKFASAASPQNFMAAGGSSSSPPRSRISTVVSEYWDMYRTAPTVEIAAELIEREGRKLGPEERAALAQEWQRVLDTEVPDDLTFVYDQARKWAEFRALESALTRAADVLAQGPDAVPAAREALEEARPAEIGRRTLWGYQQDAAERIARWRAGDEQGERIPTGLPALDRALNGGPTRKEVFYFLAPPKGAKTASLLRVALGAARRRFGVYFVTYEMQAMRTMLRLDRMAARSSRDELREDLGKLEKVLAGMRVAGAGELWVEERSPQQTGSVVEAARRVEKIRREGGVVDLVVLDFLNIMGASRVEREKRHDLAKISREIGAMGKDMDVAIWSAALVNRQAVNKRVIRKTDIAEAFEVIAVMDGGIAICATQEMVANKYRRFWVAAGREFEDEVMAGDYVVDFDRMTIDPADSREVDGLLNAEDE